MEKELMYFVLLLGFLGSVIGQSKVETAEDGSSGTISFSTPDLNDEEGHSPFMPDQLKCDACRVVALQLYEKFTEFNRIQKHFKFNVPESEVIDITEGVCATKTFESYGLKSVNKQNRLSGPGLETADTPGVMQGGGKWPGRLMDMCEQYMGNIGEMEVYNAYKKNPKSRKQFEEFLCFGTGQLGECSKVEKEMADKGIKKDEL